MFPVLDVLIALGGARLLLGVVSEHLRAAVVPAYLHAVIDERFRAHM
jgi:hypothetical protein